MRPGSSRAGDGGWYATRLILAALSLSMASVTTVQAEDWPQFLGPRRDGTSTQMIRPELWPEGGPKPLWKIPVGHGFSSPIASKGRVFLHHRKNGKEVVECWDAASGRSLWSQGVEATYRDDFGFDDGPRATPAILDNDLATMGADGEIRMLAAEDGKLRWRLDAKQTFAAQKGFFGFASSPVFAGSTVIYSIGGTPGAGLVALNRKDGSVAWKADIGEAGYASPVVYDWEGQTRLACFNRSGLHLIHSSSGQVLASFPWRSRNPASVNAATPLVSGRNLFVTSSYDTGAAWLDWGGGGKSAPKVVWSGDESLSAHYATPVVSQGDLYGFHGRQESGASLRCVDARTGKVRWEEERFGSGTLVQTASHLMILHERGELVVAPLSRSSFKPIRRFQILGSGVRASMALSDHRLFARSPKELVALPLPNP